MSPADRYVCNNDACNFELSDLGVCISVVLDDGRVEELTHPIQENRALALTGKTLDELNRAGKLTYTKLRVCTKCAQTKEKCQCRGGNAYVSLTELEQQRCPQCGTGQVEKKKWGNSR
jgi:hypothetical protein